MTAELAAAYKSGCQQTRVVTEYWGEHNLYCPNCPSDNLTRLPSNTKASDFGCPSCDFWFQLKGQRTKIGKSIADGSYSALIQAVGNDRAPSFYFLHYDLQTWTVRNLLLVPHFAFPVSAIVKRKPLSSTARRAGWVGCFIFLPNIPHEARIDIIKDGTASRPEDVRDKFRRISSVKNLPRPSRGWTLDVLTAVRSLGKTEFTTRDAYSIENALSALHPNNNNIRPKIRQQLQVLRNAKLLHHVGKGLWRIPDATI